MLPHMYCTYLMEQYFAQMGFYLRLLKCELPPQHQTDIEAKQMSECSRLPLRYWPKRLSLNEHLANEGTSFLGFLRHSELLKLMVFSSLSLSNAELTDSIDVSKYHCSFLHKNCTLEKGRGWKIKRRKEKEDKEGPRILGKKKLNKGRKRNREKDKHGMLERHEMKEEWKKKRKKIKRGQEYGEKRN